MDDQKQFSLKALVRALYDSLNILNDILKEKADLPVVPVLLKAINETIKKIDTYGSATMGKIYIKDKLEKIFKDSRTVKFIEIMLNTSDPNYLIKLIHCIIPVFEEFKIKITPEFIIENLDQTQIITVIKSIHNIYEHYIGYLERV